MLLKRLLLCILLLTLVTSQFSSCSSDKGDAASSENTSGDDSGGSADGTEPTSDPDAPDIPDDVNFNGYEFKILNTSENNIAWLMKTIVVEEVTGESLNDAIYERNLKMEDQYKFKLVQIDCSGPDDVYNKLRKSVLSHDSEYDLGMTTPTNALKFAQDGQILRMDEIPYIDLSKPYWDQDMNRDFSIANRIYFTSGDFSFNQYSSTIPVFFNKQLFADLGLENPYQLVKDGKWTIEKFGEMAKQGLSDLNGDSKYNDSDQWGYASLSHVYTLTLMVGVGARYVLKDENDIPYSNVNTEDFINKFYKLFDVLNDGNNWLYEESRNGATRTEILFQNGQSLFWSELMNWANILREMEQDFGILPCPKLDESQETYYCSTGLPHVMCIPTTTDDSSRTGIILEALCAESKKSTKTVYYDTMLKNKVVGRDEESGEMLDIIFEHRIYEVGRLYWESSIAGPVATAMSKKTRSIVSSLEKNRVAAEKAIEKAVEVFQE